MIFRFLLASASFFFLNTFAFAADIDVEKMGFTARLDTAAVPPLPKKGWGKKGYPAGQRVVYTIWLDNDDPYDGMRDVALWMPGLDDNMRLDLSLNQPAYGNIFYDSRVPDISTVPARVRMYYVTRDKGETRQLDVSANADPANIRSVVWIVRRGTSEQVLGPHNGNDDVYNRERANTAFGAPADSDVLYVRYAALVAEKPKKKK